MRGCTLADVHYFTPGYQAAVAGAGAGGILPDVRCLAPGYYGAIAEGGGAPVGQRLIHHFFLGIMQLLARWNAACSRLRALNTGRGGGGHVRRHVLSRSCLL